MQNPWVLPLASLACNPGAEVDPGTPDCAAGAWTTAGELALPHFEHLVAALPGGRALAAGGHTVVDAATHTAHTVPESEVWDPETDSWHFGGPIDPAGNALGGVVLPDGSVFVAGYFDVNGDGDHVALFDPDAETWTAGAPVPTPRWGAQATFGDGLVLNAGGGSWEVEQPHTQIIHAEVDIFDAHTGSWTATTPLDEARNIGALVELPGGDILLAGGDIDGVGTTSALRFDPTAGTWRATGSMNEPHHGPLIPLDDGRMLIVGGSTSIPQGGRVTAEVYDPQEERWTFVGSTSIDRHFASLTKLPDGSVLYAGGTSNASPTAMASAERFDPATDTWEAAAPPLHARAFHGAALLEDGSVLVAGGMNTELGTFDVSAVLEAERFVCPPR